MSRNRPQSEMERIKLAERLATKQVDNLDPKIVEQVGRANLISDLQKEYLEGSLPSQELENLLNDQTLNGQPSNDLP